MPGIAEIKLTLLAAAGIAAIYCGANALAAAANTSAALPHKRARSEQSSSASEKQKGLDYQQYKTRVEPIFLKERPGHARCYACHSEGNRLFHLEKLAAGATRWNEEQSRRNFQTVSRLVVPGDPYSSLLLLHPLAPEAGGDAFHSGGRQFQTQDDPDWVAIADWIRGAGVRLAGASETKALIYVTNSAGDTIDVIDSATNRVTQVIQGIELPHGVNFSADGMFVFVSNESESVLDVVNRGSGEIAKKISLSGHPNNITVTKDGKRVLVGIREAPGAIDVIDTASLTFEKTIPVNRRIHNIYVTPDGKFAVFGSIETKTATVLDLANDQVAWEVKFDEGVRPMAFDTNSDGSTKHIFVQFSNFNGFAVVDFAKHAEAARIQLPEQPRGFGTAEGRMGTPSHGIGVAPDGKSLWVGSTVANAVFEYSLPDLKPIGYLALPEVHGPNGSPSGSVPE